MKQIALHLVRTVFLPMGSPPIGRIDDVKADLAKAELRLDGKKLYCMGQLDVLVDYTSLAASAGRRLFADGEEQGKAWQALLDLPFALSEDVFCPPGAEISASLGRLKWFMVAPRAFELEADILAELPGRDIETEAEKYAPEKKDGGWQMVSCEDVRKEEAAAMTEVNAAKDEAEAGAAVVKNCGGKEDSPLDRAIAKIKESAAEEMNERTEGDGLCAPAEETPPAGERTAEDGAAEKEVVRIVFREDDLPAEKEIEEAIAAAKASQEAELRQAEEENVQAEAAETQETPATAAEPADGAAAAEPAEGATVAEPAEEAAADAAAAAEPPRRKHRIHGLPRLSVDAQNNNVEISAFNINIKLP